MNPAGQCVRTVSGCERWISRTLNRFEPLLRMDDSEMPEILWFSDMVRAKCGILPGSLPHQRNHGAIRPYPRAHMHRDSDLAGKQYMQRQQSGSD